jgi:hypothetical protein
MANSTNSSRNVVVIAEQSTLSRAFYRSSDLSVPFCVYIAGLEAFQLAGKRVAENGSSSWDFYVTCQIFADGKALCLPEMTSHRALVGRPLWNEWLTLPVTIDTLPESSLAVFTGAE